MEKKKNLDSSQFSINASSIFPESQIINNNEDYLKYQQELQNYENQNYKNNILNNNKYGKNQQHFEYNAQPLERSHNSISFNDNISNFTFGNNRNSSSLSNSIQLGNNIPLSKSQVVQNINQDALNYEDSCLFSSTHNLDLSNSIAIKKENHLITKTQYVAFSNNYGDNSCYVNVVLQLIYNIPDISNIFKDLYEIDEIQKQNPKEKNNNTSTSTNNNSNNNSNINNKNNSLIESSQNLSQSNTMTTPNLNNLFIEIGEILQDYEVYLKKENTTQQVTILDTKRMRISLEKISGGRFPLNYVADPIELFIFILDNLNINYQREIHSNFYLELMDKAVCLRNCPNLVRNRYDKDNFLYHIYIEELLNYISDNAIKFKNSKGDLFHLSYSLYTDEKKECQKCSLLMDKFLLCFNIPKFLIINCVWKNQNPEIKEIVNFLFLLSLEEDLNRLFICQNTGRNSNTIYNFVGMILYSYTLCHYTILIFNKKQRVFTLYNDDIVKEYKTLYDSFYEMLINNIDLYDNDKAYFYPVMLIYSKDTIYNRSDINLNSLDEKKYVELLNKIEINQNNYIKRHTLTEEQKKKNLQEMIEKQQIYEQNKLNKQKDNNNNNKNKNNLKNIDMNVETDNNNFGENNKKENDWMNYNFEDDEKKRKNKSINNIINNNANNNSTNDYYSKVYGNDLLNGKTNKSQQGMEYYKNYYEQLNNLNIDDLVRKNDDNNNIKGNIQNEYLKNIHEQSNSSIMNNNSYSYKYKNNLAGSQRMFIGNDFDELDNDRLAQSQVIPTTKYFADMNKNNNNLNRNNKNTKNNIKNDNNFQQKNKMSNDNYKKQNKNLSNSQFINPNKNSMFNDEQNNLNNDNYLSQTQNNIQINNSMNLYQSQNNVGGRKNNSNNNNLAQSQYNMGRRNKK